MGNLYEVKKILSNNLIVCLAYLTAISVVIAVLVTGIVMTKCDNENVLIILNILYSVQIIMIFVAIFMLILFYSYLSLTTVGLKTTQIFNVIKRAIIYNYNNPKSKISIEFWLIMFCSFFIVETFSTICYIIKIYKG